jgi:hypothetical protein
LKSTKSYYQIALAAFLFSLLASSAGFFLAFRETGQFCYALDDSFIMMAISKNIAFHHVWGLTQYHFSSTASSPLFAVLLAGADLIFGDYIWMPLAINVLALGGLYFLVAWLCAKWNFKLWQTWWMLLGLFFFMPVPVLLYGSMEHILHTLIAIFCLYLVLENEKPAPIWKLLLAGALLAGIRYEGLFEGGLLVLVLWSRRQWLAGICFGAGMAIPVASLGFYSMAHGWFFLPNSLVLKAYGMNIQDTRTVFGFLHSLLSKLAFYPHAISSIIVLVLIRELPESGRNQNKLWTGVVLLASVLHFVLARYGHVYRYEAYLMALGWLAYWKTCVQAGFVNSQSELLRNMRQSPIQAIIVIVLVFSPLYRSVESYAVGSKAIVNIYEQQVQTARFVHRYFNKSVIGAIDVGAIAYYSDCKLQDLWGLGTMDFAQLKLKNLYISAPIDSVSRKLGMEIAIVYGRPMNRPSWQKVESWVIRENMVCSNDTVDFYALNQDAFYQLKQHLIAFRDSLPKSVIVIPEKAK